MRQYGSSSFVISYYDAVSLFNNVQFSCFIIKIPMHIYVESDSTRRKTERQP